MFVLISSSSRFSLKRSCVVLEALASASSDVNNQLC